MERNELFVDPAWWQVLADVYGFEVCVRTAHDEHGTLVGSVPLVEIDDAAGPRRVSLPFCDFVDWPMTDDGWGQLGDDICREPTPVTFTTPADHVLSADDRFTTVIDGVHHVIAIGDPDVMADGFAELPRRMIRKAGRLGLTYRLATDAAALQQFHQLHVAVRKYRHGLLAQSIDFFRAVADNFFLAGNGGVMVAELDGEVIGGCILLVTPGAVHYKFAAANPDYYRHGVSHGLVLAALRYGAELGRPVFDFGRSDLVHPGLVSFKRRFRPIERELARHSISVDLTPRSAAFRHQLSELTNLFIDPAIPDELSAAAGAQLYRYFT